MLSFGQSRSVACGRAVKVDGQTGEHTVHYLVPKLKIWDIKGRLAVRRWQKRMKETPLWL
jgi:hypothetical protein